MKQVLVVRKDLNMRKGKIAAQAAHASMAAVVGRDGIVFDHPNIKEWLAGIFTKICVGTDSEQELIDIYERAKVANLPCSLIQDSGLTEFKNVPTYTAVAVGPAKVDVVDQITGHLRLL